MTRDADGNTLNGAHRRKYLLRGLIERVGDRPAEEGPQVEIVGEIVKMVELGLDAKQAALPQQAACSGKVVAGAGFEPATFRL